MERPDAHLEEGHKGSRLVLPLNDHKKDYYRNVVAAGNQTMALWKPVPGKQSSTQQHLTKGVIAGENPAPGTKLYFARLWFASHLGSDKVSVPSYTQNSPGHLLNMKKKKKLTVLEVPKNLMELSPEQKEEFRKIRQWEKNSMKNTGIILR